jgi:Formylglycinamide ribonucleotide amidotransferase N-terminal
VLGYNRASVRRFFSLIPSNFLQLAMADILFLRGTPAFSAFRLQGLQQRIAEAVPGASIQAAEYWHFVALRQPLADAQRRQLAALLEEHPGKNNESGELFLVTPRVGTISPASNVSNVALLIDWRRHRAR